jgi:pimeloyl-ACP methyl ester carboxylesterase
MLFKRPTFLLCAVAVIIGIPSFAGASDLSYGFIVAARAGNEVHINYRGPGDDKDVICNVTTLACRSFNPDAEPFRVTDAIDLPLTTSPDASSAVLRLNTANGTAYALLNLVGTLKLSLISLQEPGSVSRVIYSRDGKTIVFVGTNTLQVYTPANSKIISHTVSVPASLTLVSPSGDYISWYSYTSDEHIIVSLKTGKLVSIDSKTPGYFEISENGEWGIFKDVEDDKEVLRLASLPTGNTRTIFGDGQMIDDYLVHKNIAYFTSNERGPLEWSLFSYDPRNSTIAEIDNEIAYTDYMKSVGDSLLYYKVSGDHGDVYVHRTGSNTNAKLAGQTASDYTPVAVRKEIDMGDVHGALLDNDTNTGTKKPLIIWLHGGPQRQTSVGYHSYLSYGVYDEMLERFVRAGARVAKLDYTGSVGYGEDFQKDLTKKVGVADVADIVEAIEDLTDTYETGDVYIVGNSYGGYLALKTLVEEPRMIDGVASIAGVTDWDSLVTDSSSIFAPYFGGTPGSKKTKKYYAAAEIIDNIEDIPDNTPIVVVYGEQDRTVPPAQSKLFISTAEEEDKDVTALVFANEEHILRERKTLNDLCKTITKAFDLSTNVCSQ